MYLYANNIFVRFRYFKVFNYMELLGLLKITETY